MLKFVKANKWQYICLIFVILTIVTFLIITLYLQIYHWNLKLSFKNKTYNFKLVNLLWIIFAWILTVVFVWIISNIVLFKKNRFQINNNLVNETRKFNCLQGIQWVAFTIYLLPLVILILGFLIFALIWSGDFLLFFGNEENSDKE